MREREGERKSAKKLRHSIVINEVFNYSITIFFFLSLAVCGGCNCYFRNIHIIYVTHSFTMRIINALRFSVTASFKTMPCRNRQKK